MRKILSFAAIVALSLFSCNKESSSSEYVGEVWFCMCDAATTAYQSVYLEVETISFTLDDAMTQWQSIDIIPEEIDLMQYRNGDSILVAIGGIAELEAATAVNFTLGDDSYAITSAGDTIVIDVSALSGGITCEISGIEPYDLVKYYVIIDVDLYRSLTYQSGDTITFTPGYVRAFFGSGTSAVYGYVLPRTTQSYIFAILDGDTISSTLTNPTIGNDFYIGGLGLGEYTIAAMPVDGSTGAKVDVDITYTSRQYAEIELE